MSAESEGPNAAPEPAQGPGFQTGMALPALRALQVEQLQVKNDEGDQDPETVVVLKDPDGWCTEPAALSPGAFAVAALFDGKKSAADVKAVFKERYNQIIEEDQILSLAHELDKTLLLSSSKFEEKVKQVVIGYLGAQVRPAVFAGEAYPSDPHDLLKMVESFFTMPDAPGVLPEAKPASEHLVKGLIVPHIDFNIGGATYAHGYKALLEKSQADLFVVLGVAHKGSPDVLFNVSTKDQATPWGPVKTARGFSRRLQENVEAEFSIQEFAHRTEFSVEFQAVMLGGLLGQRNNQSFEIVPVLCGSVEPFLDPKKNPADDDSFKRFVGDVREELEKSNRRWCILASVDFSHVGPKFDHSTAIDKRMLPPIERGDQRLLKPLANLDRDAFFDEIVRTKNARNVDAVMAVMALLSIGEGTFQKGELLHYAANLEAPTRSAVSFASMAFQ